MHIPDGYLSPATAAAMYAASAPFWYVAVRRVRTALNNRTVPVLALFAAFAFVLQMFNIPLPGGTSGHAVGGTLLAIVAGPWAAVVGISVVLGIQALFFGDGGLLTLGANCFNMAILLPLLGYVIYRMVSGNSDSYSRRRLVAAIAGSYVAMAVASFATGFELGIQPLLFHTADGTPLYAPYGLNIAVPAMLAGSLLITGTVEALVTGLVVAYLQRTRSALLSAGTTGRGSRLLPLWVGLIVLAHAVPLGLIASGAAWGEWAVDELAGMGLGFVPQGLQQMAGWWPALLPDYSFYGLGAALGYVLSAMIGIALIMLLFIAGGRLLARGGKGVRGEGFLAGNIARLTGTLESAISGESLSHAAGLLQGIDARVKTVTFFFLIVIIGLVQSLAALGLVFALIIAVAAASRVPPSFFLKRVGTFIPLFTAVVAVPALFVVPGEPLSHLGGVSITVQGVHTAALLLLRVTDSLSLGILLVLTTSWAEFLAALRWLRVPSVVVAILGMTYRYILLLLRAANSMFLARRSRNLGGFSSREDRRWLARSLATTMARSQHMGEQVYLAMLSRGYSGEVRVLRNFSARRRDAVWAGLVLACGVLLLWGSAI